MQKLGGINEPFRVAAFTDVFSAQLYRSLKEWFPTENYFFYMESVGHKFSFNEHSDNFGEFLSKSPHWQGFYTWIKSQDFLDWTYHYFPYFEKEKIKYAKFEFSKMPADKGFIHIHPDSPSKIITLVYYLAHNWNQAWGGEFEASKHRINHDQDFHGVELLNGEVETIFEVPYIPNTIVFLRRQPNSLHQVRPMKGPKDKYRHSVTINLMSK